MDGTFPSRITDRKPLIAPDAIKEISSGPICKIAARIIEKDGVSKILRIWLEYLGNFDQSLQGTPLHEFCIVTFPYSTSMDKPNTGIDDLVKYGEKNEGDSGVEIEGDSGVEEFDEWFKEVMNSAFANYCGLCHDKMITDAKVAALLKTETGRLVCAERNSTGAYHVYHLPCLVRWILICEAKKIEEQNFSVYCPECEGTGVIIDENGMKQFAPKRLERDDLVLKMNAGAKEWKEFPEVLENISVGLGFPREENFLQELLPTLYLTRIFNWRKP